VKGVSCFGVGVAGFVLWCAAIGIDVLVKMGTQRSDTDSLGFPLLSTRQPRVQRHGEGPPNKSRSDRFFQLPPSPSPNSMCPPPRPHQYVWLSGW